MSLTSGDGRLGVEGWRWKGGVGWKPVRGEERKESEVCGEKKQLQIPPGDSGSPGFLGPPSSSSGSSMSVGLLL